MASDYGDRIVEYVREAEANKEAVIDIRRLIVLLRNNMEPDSVQGFAILNLIEDKLKGASDE